MGKIKEHVKENKTTYIVGGVCLVVGAGVTVIAVGRNNQVADVVQKIVQVGFRNEANATVIYLTEKSTPSKPVHLVGTNQYFDSISDAARKTGHPLSTLSKHVNGLIPDVKGDVFEVLEPA